MVDQNDDDRPAKRPRLSVENADGYSSELTPPVSSPLSAVQDDPPRESDMLEMDQAKQAPVDVDMDMDLQPSSQPSERDGALLFESQEDVLSATLRTPVSDPTANRAREAQSEDKDNEKVDTNPQTSPVLPEVQPTEKAEQAVEDDDTEYDDPWFDAACLTTTDAGGNILPDHLPVPPSSTPGKKKDLERRRSSEIKRSQEFKRSQEGKAIRETYMRSQAAMAPVVEEKEPEKVAQPQPRVSAFSFGNGLAVPPVSEESKAKAAKVLAEEDPMDTFGLGPATKVANAEDDDYFSMGIAPANSSADFESGSMAFPAFTGFQTGKGKKFAGPSSATKARIANMFAEDLDGLPTLDDIFKSPVDGDPKATETPSRALQTGNGFVTPGPKPTIVPAFTAPAVSETPTKSTAFVPHKSVSGMSSFQTASGTKVPAISAEAKARALALFADEGLGSADLPSSIAPFGEFSTPGPKRQAQTVPTAPTESFGAGDDVTMAFDDSGVMGPSIAVQRESFATGTSAMSSRLPASIVPETPIRPVTQTAETRQPADLIKDVTNQTPIRHSASQAKPFRPLLTPLPPVRQDLARPPASPLASPRLGIGLGMTPRSKSTLNKRPAFKTPFKPNSSSFSTPSISRMPSSIRTPGPSMMPRAKPAPVVLVPVFDMKCPVPRQTMSEAGLKPQQVSAEAVAQTGCPEEIAKIDANNALFYHFAVDDALKGPEDALKQIQADGCSQIALKWVNNHWSLILWKLASIVRANPSLWKEKWTYLEVLRQLKYRYEREVNLAQRSAIKRMQEQDSPASLPMVLCVASITTMKLEQAQHVQAPSNSSILELTDGWYRIKASADAALQRAIEAGRLRSGYKIAIAGARLDATKDGTDVLDALGKSTLRISGNSTSLVPWDRRLGLSLQPFIATMSSLTKDGGSVPLMAVKISRVYPLAYMAKEKGKGSAPWSEAEEFRLQEEWTQRYNQERERLREACDKRLHTLEDDLDRLKQQCEGLGVAAESVDDAEDVSDQVLEDYHQTNQKSTFLRNLGNVQILALAQKAQEEFLSESSSGQAETEDTLRNVMPPRATRSFQVIRMEDIFPNSKGRKRTAQLQVWDAHQLARGILKENGNYLVSNLAPAQPASWCNAQESGEIFLCTNRNTTWKRLE